MGSDTTATWEEYLPFKFPGGILEFWEELPGTGGLHSGEYRQVPVHSGVPWVIHSAVLISVPTSHP